MSQVAPPSIPFPGSFLATMRQLCIRRPPQLHPSRPPRTEVALKHASRHPVAPHECCDDQRSTAASLAPAVVPPRKCVLHSSRLGRTCKPDRASRQIAISGSIVTLQITISWSPLQIARSRSFLHPIGRERSQRFRQEAGQGAEARQKRQGVAEASGGLIAPP
jgi:hypothetical protein